MAELISLRLPIEEQKKIRELAEAEDKDSSAFIRELIRTGIREKELIHILELYQKGKVTMWKAAKLADISLWELTDLMRERKIIAQYTLDDLKEDLEA